MFRNVCLSRFILVFSFFFFFSPRFYTFARVSFPSASTLVLDEVEKTVQEAREKDWLASYRIPVILILQGVLIHLIDSFLTRTWTKTNRTLKRERENLSNHLVFQIIIKCINYHMQNFLHFKIFEKINARLLSCNFNFDTICIH